MLLKWSVQSRVRTFLAFYQRRTAVYVYSSNCSVYVNRIPQRKPLVEDLTRMKNGNESTMTNERQAFHVGRKNYGINKQTINELSIMLRAMYFFRYSDILDWIGQPTIVAKRRRGNSATMDEKN